MSVSSRQRITRTKYEKARRCVDAAREQMHLVRLWEDAARRIGQLGNQRLIAVTIEPDGSLRTECEIVAETPAEESQS